MLEEQKVKPFLAQKLKWKILDKCDIHIRKYKIFARFARCYQKLF